MLSNQSLVGCYRRWDTNDQRYHTAEIQNRNNELTWKNDNTGQVWSIRLNGKFLNTDESCPYYRFGMRSMDVLVEGDAVVGVKFMGNSYFAARPYDHKQHQTNSVARTDSKSVCPGERVPCLQALRDKVSRASDKRKVLGAFLVHKLGDSTSSTHTELLLSAIHGCRQCNRLLPKPSAAWTRYEIVLWLKQNPGVCKSCEDFVAAEFINLRSQGVNGPYKQPTRKASGKKLLGQSRGREGSDNRRFKEQPKSQGRISTNDSLGDSIYSKPKLDAASCTSTASLTRTAASGNESLSKGLNGQQESGFLDIQRSLTLSSVVSGSTRSDASRKRPSRGTTCVHTGWEDSKLKRAATQTNWSPSTRKNNVSVEAAFPQRDACNVSSPSLVRMVASGPAREKRLPHIDDRARQKSYKEALLGTLACVQRTFDVQTLELQLERVLRIQGHGHTVQSCREQWRRSQGKVSSNRQTSHGAHGRPNDCDVDPFSLNTKPPPISDGERDDFMRVAELLSDHNTSTNDSCSHDRKPPPSSDTAS